MSVSFDSSLEDIKVVGQLPARNDDVDTGEYTCVWGFTQRWNDGGPTDIYGIPDNDYISEGVGPDDQDQPYDRVSSGTTAPVTPPGSTASEQQSQLEDVASGVSNPGQPFQNFVGFADTFTSTAPNETNHPFENFAEN